VRMAVLCPGQGALAAQAGRPWADHPSWSIVERVEAVLERPVGRLLLDADETELAATDAAQVATLTLALVGMDALRVARPDLTPVAVAGHSLGQVTALIVAGALTFEAGVTLAGARAAATRRADDSKKGCLAAFIGCEVAVAQAACADVGDCWVAIENAPGQVVVGGHPDAVERAIEVAKAGGARGGKRLPVGAAFHTPWIAAAADELAPIFESAPWQAPTIPVVANVDAQPYEVAEVWSEQLRRQLIEPVLWTDSQRCLTETLGVTHAVELPPSGVLKALAKRTVPDLIVHSIATPEDIAGTASW
jgi:[acyl-carrier-protein] S-malonyltransferase